MMKCLKKKVLQRLPRSPKGNAKEKGAAGVTLYLVALATICSYKHDRNIGDPDQDELGKSGRSASQATGKGKSEPKPCDISKRTLAGAKRWTKGQKPVQG